jgi:hypothetical protein
MNDHDMDDYDLDEIYFNYEFAFGNVVPLERRIIRNPGQTLKEYYTWKKHHGPDMSHYEHDDDIPQLYEWVDACMELDRWTAVIAYFAYYYKIDSDASYVGIRPQIHNYRKCSLGQILLRDVIKEAVYHKNVTFLNQLLDQFADSFEDAIDDRIEMHMMAVAGCNGYYDISSNTIWYPYELLLQQIFSLEDLTYYDKLELTRQIACVDLESHLYTVPMMEQHSRSHIIDYIFSLPWYVDSDVLETVEIVFIGLQLAAFNNNTDWLTQQISQHSIGIDDSDVFDILEGIVLYLFPLHGFDASISENEAFLLVFEKLLTIIAGHVDVLIKKGNEDLVNLWIAGVRITGPLSRLVHIQLNDRTVILQHIDARTISDAEIERVSLLDWKLLVQREKNTLEWMNEVVETGENIPFPVEKGQLEISDIVNEYSHLPDPIPLLLKIVLNLYQPYHKASIHPFKVMMTEYIKTFFTSSDIPVYRSIKEYERNQVYENSVLATARKRIVANQLELARLNTTMNKQDYEKLEHNYNQAKQHARQTNKRAREAWELEKQGLLVETKEDDEYTRQVNDTSQFIDKASDQYLYSRFKMNNPVVTDIMNHMYDIDQYKFLNTEDKFIIQFTRD